MKIGYFTEGRRADEAFIQGLAKRWCPEADLEPPLRCRGRSGETLRRELRIQVLYFREEKDCDVIVVLTDSDEFSWREKRDKESMLIPEQYRHLTVYGVAERNIECWLALDREGLGKELGCRPEDIPKDDPSGFISRKFKLSERNEGREEAKSKLADFVARSDLKKWIQNSPSFKAFYEDVRDLSQQKNCGIRNELENE
jgi:hypothetical protein